MIGSRLGHWVIDKELGKGGMGAVYLAHEESTFAPASTQNLAALKILPPELARALGFVQRFRREIESLSLLKHPNIVRFYDSGQENGCYYYAMEYVEGPNCEQLLKERKRLPWQEVLELALQVCPALKHAHDHGIIHRDLKPANLLINKDGVVKLADFGIAKAFSGTPLTGTLGIVGTAAFLSPEQAMGKPVTKRSDLYSFGVVLYTLLTGQPPFSANSQLEMLQKHRYGQFDAPNQFVQDIPTELNAIVCRLMEKDPAKRPPDALVLARQLELIRSKSVTRSHQTDDAVRHAETIAEGAPPTQGAAASTVLTKWLFRGKPGDTLTAPLPNHSKRKAVFLFVLLAAIVAAMVYGLWPASAKQLLQDADQLIAAQEWNRAEEKLDLLQKRFGSDLYTLQVDEMRQRIENTQAQRKARRIKATVSPGGHAGGEAERFYLEAELAFRQGRFEEARKKWQSLITAFQGVESEAPWVQLAKESLRDSQIAELDVFAVENAIRMAEKENTEEGRKRLQALWDLYHDRPGPAAERICQQIETALQKASRLAPASNAP